MSKYINLEEALNRSRTVVEYDEGGWDISYKAVPVEELEKLKQNEAVVVLSDQPAIDATRFLKALEYEGADVIEDRGHYADFGYSMSLINEILSKQPILIMPVGRWILQKTRDLESIFSCSSCGREIKVMNEHWRVPSTKLETTHPYCHCGAKMSQE